jgi:integrase
MGTQGTGKLKALFASRQKKPGMYHDGGGLYLQITSASARSWVFRYWVADRDPGTGEFLRDDAGRICGRSREMGLGSLHIVSLQDARDLAGEYRRMRRVGVDPIEAKRTAQMQQRLDSVKAITFKRCAADYIEAHRSEWKDPKHLQQWQNSIAQHAEPVIGDLSVQAIDTTAVHKVLAPIWTSIPETAGRLRGRIEAILDRAKVLGYRTGENPARWRGHLDKLLPKPSKVRKVEHHAAMPFAEIPKFMAALHMHETVVARALEFLILTAARSSEVLGAKWNELDLQGAVWTVPGERMKASKAHRVPLAPAALRIVNAMAASKGGEFVFPGNNSGDSLSEKVLWKMLRRMKIENVTPHGFRSTFRDWAAERTSYQNHVVEMALAHTIGDKVEAAYRRGDLFEKRRKLMHAWAQFCNAPASTGDVIPLRHTN